MRALASDLPVDATLATSRNPYATIEVAVSSLPAANIDGSQPSSYQVDDLIVDIGRRSVSRDGAEIPFPALSFDLLLALVRASPNYLSHDQLMAQVWQGAVVNSETISQRVKLVRGALGDDPSEPRYIAGIRGRGYRLLPPAVPTAPAADGVPRAATAPPDTARWSRRYVAAIAFASLLAAGGVSVLVLRTKPMPANNPATAPSVLVVSAPRSIAVLPFTNQGDATGQEYIADGMAEEMLEVLLEFPELTVIGRRSSFSFRDSSDDVRTIGANLGATHLLEGSVRLSGDRIRLHAQLIDARSGAHLWSGSYEHGLADAPVLQAEIARRIGHALRLKAAADPAREVRPLGNTAAYTSFLRGRASLAKGGEGVAEAKAYFAQALALDPTLTRAQQAMALLHASDASWPAAIVAARGTLQLDPESALAHAILGTERACAAFDWSGAHLELDQTLLLQPRSPAALSQSAWLAFILGRHSEAMRLQDAALGSDPLNPELHRDSAWMRYYLGDLQGAEREFQASLRLSPTLAGSHYGRGVILLLRQQPEAALGEMQAEPVRQDAGLALAYHALGREEESDAALARLAARSDPDEACDLASGYAYRNQPTRAFESLEACIGRRERTWAGRLQYDPLLAPLRSDPRFKALLRQVNLDDAPGLTATAAPAARLPR